MKVVISKSFQRDVKRVTNKAALVELQSLIGTVDHAGSRREIPQLRKIKGMESAYRIGLGDHRVGVINEKDTVTFVRFFHRRDIYRRFP